MPVERSSAATVVCQRMAQEPCACLSVLFACHCELAKAVSMARACPIWSVLRSQTVEAGPERVNTGQRPRSRYFWVRVCALPFLPPPVASTGYKCRNGNVDSPDSGLTEGPCNRWPVYERGRWVSRPYQLAARDSALKSGKCEHSSQVCLRRLLTHPTRHPPAVTRYEATQNRPRGLLTVQPPTTGRGRQTPDIADSAMR